MLLLGLWLILTGLMPFLNLSVSGLGVILQVLAIAAGVLILQGAIGRQGKCYGNEKGHFQSGLDGFADFPMGKSSGKYF
jgi:hypothetical protein